MGASEFRFGTRSGRPMRGGRSRARCAGPILGAVFAASACNPIAGIEPIPCEPGCKDETTRVYCDAAGTARTEVCPSSTHECARPACEAGACSFKPAVGAACGETATGRCNEGFACLGRTFYLSTLHRHTCLVAVDGAVWCWGDNTYGQLGDGTYRRGLYPVRVQGLPGPVEMLFTGHGHTCVRLRSDDIYCWGNNEDGQCGVAPSDPVLVPVLVDVRGIRLVEIGCGEKHSCARADDGTVYCWGSNEYGQSGHDPALTGPHIVGPTKVPGLEGMEHVNAIGTHSCASRSEPPYIVCWGSNINGKLGPEAGEVTYSAVPIPVPFGSPVRALGMGPEATFVVASDGSVHAWGDNRRHQLGVESREEIVRRPSQVMFESSSGIVPLRGVSFAINNLCVGVFDRLAFGSTYVCWGTDDWGELGAGTEQGARALHPYAVVVGALPSTASSLVRGDDHACAAVSIDARSEIQCYGRPGDLGNGASLAPDGDPPSYWEGAPVVWDPANFAPALD
jgi:alpha-tubulin suppressor-like RCC1 family protein